VPPHSTIVLDAQRYELSAPLVISKSLTIQGAGVDATTITSSVGGTIILFEGDGQWTLSDLTVARTSEFASNIIFVFDGEITLDNCRLSDGAGSEDKTIRGDGLRLLGNAQAVITNCSFVNNAGAGLVVANATSATIEQAICSENGTGMAFGGDTTGALRNSTCAGNRNSGVMLLENAQISILNNVIENNGGSGLFIDLDSAGGEIRDNTLSQNFMSTSGTDIQIWGPFIPELVGNSCSNETDRPSILGGHQDGILFLMLDPVMRGQEVPSISDKYSTDNDCDIAICTGVTMFDADCR
jgi:parallel beta-helix repeat protein